MKRLFLILIAIAALQLQAAAKDKSDYKKSKEYLVLRDSVHHAFNDGDSARFWKSVRRLEHYLQQHDDAHAYYTQRCNEIVFELNRERVFEAYKLATRLSKELAEKKLDKEMFMAVNMMGHIYRYCGNKESAKRCFWEVIRRMEQEGYTESQPPIYMNLVNIVMDENPQEALRLIDQAVSIAKNTSPERVFDIEARRTLAYYLMGDNQRFLEGYKSYKEGVDSGFSSVHGRKLEVYYLAMQGKVDEAARMALDSDDDPYETQADIYARAGRWQDAYKALQLGTAESDSINSIILSSSMQGIQNELQVYEANRRAGRMWFYGLSVMIVLLLLLIIALVYIVHSRRRHLQEIQKAYLRVLEADKMKADFIQNVSHEVRTPLNIISGFAQVLADPDYDVEPDERRRMADTMTHNTSMITNMINEVLEISRGDATDGGIELTPVKCNDMMHRVVSDFCKQYSCKKSLFTIDTTLDDDFTIRSHEGLMRRILNPLLDNARKNVPATGGHVLLRISTKKSQLVIAVEDNGKGVPHSEADHIFERFVKLDTFKEGLGIGLTFCRTMVRRLGGDVRLDTAFEGPGARFVVTIPL